MGDGVWRAVGRPWGQETQFGVQKRELAQAKEVDITQATARIKGNPEIYKGFPLVPQVESWKQVFLTNRLRNPSLLARGRLHTGKAARRQETLIM